MFDLLTPFPFHGIALHRQPMPSQCAFRRIVYQALHAYFDKDKYISLVCLVMASAGVNIDNDDDNNNDDADDGDDDGDDDDEDDDNADDDDEDDV